MKITAAVCRGQGEDFQIEEVNLADPREDEVLVRNVGAGVCHTDLICRDQWYPVPLPAVFGHEGSGVVEAVGKNVTRVQPGDHVVMSYMSCGICKSCTLGRPAYCAQLYGANFSGGRLSDESSALTDAKGERLSGHFFGQSSWASHSIAYERSVVKVDPAAPLELLGPMGCGIQTGAAAVLSTFNPELGTSIAIFGAGSVGLAALMAAKAVGCTTIIAVDIKPQRLELAKSLGATHGVNGAEVDSVEAIKEITGGGADYSIELTASPKVARQAIDSLGTMGTCALIGAAALGTEYSFDMNDVMLAGKRIVGHIESGNLSPQIFIPRLVTLMQQGNFPLEKLVTTYKLDEVNKAAHDTEAGVSVKPVLVF
ncbi:MAG TPA: NAD(P)-dependent alcohol dehydrogenase [Sporichthyaceae bacterium]|nr:NAD(P)-dependent alcohol dehydrogenase [Sporichthyaceae bacterium]